MGMARAVEMEINGEWWAVDEGGGWLRHDPLTDEWTVSEEGPGAVDDDAVGTGGAERPPRAPASASPTTEVRAFHDRLVAEAQRFVDEPVLACGLFSSTSGLLAMGLESASPIVGRLVAGRLAQSSRWALVLVAVTWTHVYVFGAEQDESPFSGDVQTKVTGLLETWERSVLSVRQAERPLAAGLLDRVARGYVIDIAEEGRAVRLESVALGGRLNDEVIRLLRDQEEPA